jgi:hypothetical protein
MALSLTMSWRAWSHALNIRFIELRCSCRARLIDLISSRCAASDEGSSAAPRHVTGRHVRS